MQTRYDCHECGKVKYISEFRQEKGRILKYCKSCENWLTEFGISLTGRDPITGKPKNPWRAIYY